MRAAFSNVRNRTTCRPPTDSNGDLVRFQRERLGLEPSQSRLTFDADMHAAARSADFIQENGPERIDFKKEALPGARRVAATRRDRRIELLRPDHERDSVRLSISSRGLRHRSSLWSSLK